MLDLATKDHAVVQAGRRFERRLWTDSGSVAFLVTHATLGRREVAKAIEWQRHRVDELERRARAFGCLRSERVARIHDFLFPGDDREEIVEAPLVFLQYIEGEHLDDRIAKGPIDVRIVLDYLLALCEPLAELQANKGALGLLHPRMIVIVDDGSAAGRIRLTDFGMGDPQPPYRAPEAGGHSATSLDDIYALGVLATMMLQSPLGRRDRIRPRQSLNNLDIPAELRAVIRAMLADSHERLADVAEVARRLVACQQALAVRSATASDRRSEPPPVFSTPRHPSAPNATISGEHVVDPPLRPPHPRVLLAVVGLVVCAALVGLVAWTHDAAKETPSVGAASVPAGAVGPALAKHAPPATASGGTPTALATLPPRPAAAREAPVMTPEPPVETEPWPVLDDALITPRLPLAWTPVLHRGHSLYVARREVTRGQWHELMRDGPEPAGERDAPATGVTSCQAVAFCNRLSRAEGLSMCYDEPRAGERCMSRPAIERPCTGYRLPTVREWKAIAAAGGIKPGEAMRQAPRPGVPTCSTAADRLGLCEMYGGVWEWTESRAKDGGFYRVGGSWERAHRDWVERTVSHAAGLGTTYLGFRPVRVIEAPPIVLGAVTVDRYADDLRGPGGRAALAEFRGLMLRAITAGGRLTPSAVDDEAARAMIAAFATVGASDGISVGPDGLRLHRVERPATR